ncbi:GDSL-type esterase/lipase family protein [Bradyrhizobium yuanmingense]|uniref:GDSL-type esterase/lipase family protein n=1 Tax=Bradyrhizobium yuanmingense TaxID=108015 RepID=UPI0023B9D0F1|nr:GDSL-type esterase/lipase family protein [Bradyrhizobium yuanmingense]MDF0517498.1 GDSL-type esterase/lipase family protein [Bradyrhizobium yuanmingense]
MKSRLGTSVTALFITTLTLRATIIIAGVCIVLAWAPIRAEERTIKIVVLGDTLIENKGVPAFHRFPEQLELALRAKGQSVAVVNAGLVTDTAARSLRRFDRVVTDDTDAVILVLGGNDMLWGIDANVVRGALAEILGKLEARRIAVLLCGLRTQSKFGDEYKNTFAAMFSGLASEHNVLFYPAFDDAFVENAQLKALDGLHPNAAGNEAVVTRMLPTVETLIGLARRRHSVDNGPSMSPMPR